MRHHAACRRVKAPNSIMRGFERPRNGLRAVQLVHIDIADPAARFGWPVLIGRIWTRA